MTTLTTVGYGDITAANSIERGVCIIVMLGGVFFYSYTIGTITSLMSDFDRRQSKLNSKLLILQDIDKNYTLGKHLIKKIKSALEYDENRYNKEKSEMILSLPKKLALQLNLLMNKKLVEKNNKFFENRSIPFINSVLSFLRPLKIKSKDHVFCKSEYSIEMYFITSGEISCYDTVNSVDISFDSLKEGDYFGDIGVIMSEPYEFSVKAVSDSELMALRRDDLFSKILTVFEDLKLDLIVKTTQRRDIVREKRDKAISEFISHKNLARSLTVDHKKTECTESPVYAVNNEKNAKRIRKIRNTLSPKTLSMLEFASINDLEKIKNEIENLKLAVNKFQQRIKYDNKNKNSVIACIF